MVTTGSWLTVMVTLAVAVQALALLVVAVTVYTVVVVGLTVMLLPVSPLLQAKVHSVLLVSVTVRVVEPPTQITSLVTATVSSGTGMVVTSSVTGRLGQP